MALFICGGQRTPFARVVSKQSGAACSNRPTPQTESSPDYRLPAGMMTMHLSVHSRKRDNLDRSTLSVLAPFLYTIGTTASGEMQFIFSFAFSVIIIILSTKRKERNINIGCGIDGCHAG